MEENKIKKDYLLPVSILISGLIMAGAWVYTAYNPVAGKPQFPATGADKIGSEKGVILPVTWNDLGQRLTKAGAIDAPQFEKLLSQRGEFTNEIKTMLSGSNSQKIKITPQNANTLLNFFWALGLANKNEILEKGPMSENGEIGRFASTGGWPLAVGRPMDHYSMHSLVNLTPEQQQLVKEASQNIYRPCCNNPVYFPDCNHGLAMLGLLELMASQGATREEIYQAALAVNSYWFPDQYLKIAQFLKSKNIDWEKVSPEKILGKEFSSASGYQWVTDQTTQPE